MGLIGRHAELAVLRERLSAARRGRPAVVFVAGEPGVGKTRLATEAADLAHARGFHVAWGHCRETEGAPAYWPWTQALRTALRHVPDEDVPAESAEVRPLLELSTASIGTDRFRLFDAVGRVLEQIAQRRPLLLVFDDLHRADYPSLRLLRFVAGGTGDVPLLVLGTYRHTEIDDDHALVQLAEDEAGSEGFSLLSLDGLSLQETVGLVEHVVGTDSRLDVQAVHEQTGGNPFFGSCERSVGGFGPPVKRNAASGLRFRLFEGRSRGSRRRRAQLQGMETVDRCR